MHINTIEEDYEYRMKGIMKKFIKDYNLQRFNPISPEELQDILWADYAKEFAHTVLEDMQDYSGDELFHLDEYLDK